MDGYTLQYHTRDGLGLPSNGKVIIGLDDRMTFPEMVGAARYKARETGEHVSIFDDEGEEVLTVWP